jgi:osmotically-inducible protein OsmY
MSLVIDRPVRAPKELEASADRKIMEAATQRLRTSPYLPLRIVRCECKHGVLTLAGRVPSFYHRQVAQASVRDLAGLLRIDDQLVVQTP